MAELAAPPKPNKMLSKHHTVALELIATLALTVSLVVAATAVSLANRSLARGNWIERPVAPMPLTEQLQRRGRDIRFAD